MLNTGWGKKKKIFEVMSDHRDALHVAHCELKRNQLGHSVRTPSSSSSSSSSSPQSVCEQPNKDSIVPAEGLRGSAATHTHTHFNFRRNSQSVCRNQSKSTGGTLTLSLYFHTQTETRRDQRPEQGDGLGSVCRSRCARKPPQIWAETEATWRR